MCFQQDDLLGFNEEGFTRRIGFDTKRQSYHVSVELIVKLRAYAYRKRLGISEVVNLALEEFFSGKVIKEIPPNHRQRRGRLVKHR